MKKDADAHAEEDKKKRQVIDLKNQADQLIYSTEKTLKEHGGKVSADTRGKIESAVNNLKEAVKGDDGSAIKKAIENLGDAGQELRQNTLRRGSQKAGIVSRLFCRRQTGGRCIRADAATGR